MPAYVREAGEQQHGMLVVDAVAAYLQACRAENLSPKTLLWYEHKLRRWQEWLERDGVVEVELVTRIQHDGFITSLRANNPAVRSRVGRELSSHTVRGYVQVIKGFLHWCEVNEVGAVPNLRIRMPKRNLDQPTPLRPEEVNALLQAPSTRTVTGVRDRAVLSLLVDTGLRSGELCRLVVEDVVWRGGVGGHGEVIVRRGKGGKQRVVPFGRVSGRVLRRWLAVRKQLDVNNGSERRSLFLGQYGRELTPNAVNYLVHVHSHRALTKRIHPHLLRHTFAVLYLRNRGDVFTLQRMLGHTTLEMVRRYVNLANEDVERAYRQAGPLDNLRLDRG